MTPAVLVDEVKRLGGTIVLLLYVDRPAQLEIAVPPTASWLINEIRKRKPEVVVELKQRYLRCAVLSERVQ